MKPSVRSLIDLYRLAISYPVKLLLFSGQKNKAKIALAWSSADLKGEKYSKPNGKYVRTCMYFFTLSRPNRLTNQSYVGVFFFILRDYTLPK